VFLVRRRAGDYGLSARLYSGIPLCWEHDANNGITDDEFNLLAGATRGQRCTSLLDTVTGNDIRQVIAQK
jgi:hypothetical protein